MEVYIFKGFFKSTWFYISLLIVLMAPLYVNLLSDRLVQGHDALSGFIRAVCMDRYWGDGQFLARWSPEVNFGYGSPMFDFYPPFFYDVTLLISKITQNIALAMNLTCFVCWVLSGVGMFFLAMELWGNKGGLLSAILYVYSPYYVQDFYVRGAFSEFSIFMVFPFLLLSIYKINQQVQLRYILLGIISTFISILTHGMGISFIAMALFYAVFLYFLNKNHRAFLLGIFVLFIGFMMASFYWLAAFWDTQYINLGFLISMRYDFHKNFISLGQLFCLQWDFSKDINRLSLQIGSMHLILCFISLFVIVGRFRDKSRSIMGHYLFFLVFGCIAAILTLPVSSMLWEHINVLRFIQLPWRFLTLVSFNISLLAGSLFLLPGKKILGPLFLGLIIVLVILSPLKYYWPGNFQSIDQNALKDHLSSYLFLGEGERTPKWIKVPPDAVPSQKLEIIKGSGQVFQDKSMSSIDHTQEVIAYEPVMACYHSFYFPGWRVFIDGSETKIYPDNIFGLIVFVVPPGEHMVRVVFGQTPIRLIGCIISWAGFFLLLGVILWAKSAKQLAW